MRGRLFWSRLDKLRPVCVCIFVIEYALTLIISNRWEYDTLQYYM